MFRVMNYRIRFCHAPKNGSTTLCFVSRDNEDLSYGSSHKHPHDCYCRVEGKKVALSHALSRDESEPSFVPKDERRAIWSAFWDYVRSWSHDKAVRYEGR